MIQDTFLLRSIVNCLVIGSIVIADEKIPGTFIPRMIEFKKRKNHIAKIGENDEYEC